MDYCFTKNLDMVLYSHSKGSGKHRNGTRTPGSSRTLKIEQAFFRGGVYTPAGKSFMRFVCITTRKVSEQLVRPNPDGQTLPA